MKTISRILILAMLHLCWLTSYGWAEMVPTESAVQVQDDRQRLLDLLDRQDVIDELEKYGISKVEAVARINSLSDEEVVVIAGKLDELSEGGQANMGGPMIIALFALPFILVSVLYLAFTPIAAGVCVFTKDTWSDCMEGYAKSYGNVVDVMNCPPNGCVSSVQAKQCKKNPDTDDFLICKNPKGGLCQNIDTNEWVPCDSFAGEWWCQKPDTKEWILCPL